MTAMTKVNDQHIEYEIQVNILKDKVWIHASDGSTVGRFGKMGVDLHTTATEQLNGTPECRICTHGRVGRKDWELFVNKSLEFWGVVVPVDAFNEKWFERGA